MILSCDNKSTIYTTYSLVKYERIKYIELDKYFIKEKLDSGMICTHTC